MFFPSAEFAYNSTVSEDIGISPFEIDLAWKPKTPLYMLYQSSTPFEAVFDFHDRLKAVAQEAQYVNQLTKARQTRKRVFILRSLCIRSEMMFGFHENSFETRTRKCRIQQSCPPECLGLFAS